ncbi:hypothetical protein BT69DRAFT_1266403 [Atractiella rhizophila]|nr:hypothetical protein BT69DRAFT_1266403 [Atractiella rhizophila]
MRPFRLPQQLLQLSRASKRWNSTVPPRKKQYKTLDAGDITFFRSVISNPDSNVITSLKPAAVDEAGWKEVEEVELGGYNEDWMGKYKGRSVAVVRPKRTEEVSKLLAYCYKQNIAVVPQGGNTGLVGGSVPVHDELVLNLSGMNIIRSFDEVSGVITLDAGCVLQNVDDYLAAKGYIFPLDLGAKGSCQIGGNISTNAGGLRLLRYGSLHGNVLGLEVVLPDEEGTVLRMGMGGLRKDNTGYDLKQLFIGAEGTLGIVTGACILAPQRPKSTGVALLSVSSWEDLLKVFIRTKSSLSEILSAFEFFDPDSLDIVQTFSDMRAPFEQDDVAKEGFYILIETSGSRKEHDDEKLQDHLESLMTEELITNGVVAADETQLQQLWAIRESIAENGAKLGKVYKYDLSLPVREMYSVVEKMRKRFKEHGLGDDVIRRCIGFGHVGDGNIHLNVIASRYDPKIEEIMEPWVFEETSRQRGSISAEHGLGLQKAPFIEYSQEASTVDRMRMIKKIFDPKSILSPYKVFPSSISEPKPAAEQS